MDSFLEAYTSLNREQRLAVETIDGPVMVVAGPGTGKTQVLALRIAYIMQKTDTPASGILCLTFTRAGVKAMRERLVRIMGNRAQEVYVTTFHSFAIQLIEKHYALLDFEIMPSLLDSRDAVGLIDELLEGGEWKYLRPRGNSATYFSDITSLVSLLKRERLTPEAFLIEIDHDIKALMEDPDSLSSRGPTKGQLKKEIQKRIEGLERTREVVQFYEQYEAVKRERALMDYDDVLEYAIALVEISDDVRADVRENYLYVLVDEHQDSSGVQNGFLKAVWEDTERPNIFVVGDDRQLIYGFGGASISYFEEFKHFFGKATLITLIQNYRSTAPILALADDLLASSMTTEKLQSNRREHHLVSLAEYAYPRDEIIAAGLALKDKIESGIAPEQCALLVPKNRHVRSAIAILRDMGVPVRAEGGVSFFTIAESIAFRRVLAIITEPFNARSIVDSLFDVSSGVAPLDAHRFVYVHGARSVTLDMLLQSQNSENLLDDSDSIHAWGQKLNGWLSQSKTLTLEVFVQTIGNELLIETAVDHDDLLRRVEVVRTMIHLVMMYIERAPKASLRDFMQYLDRLEQYGHNLPVATLSSGSGVSVMTLHASKGLEYDMVWIAHMNENVLMSGKRGGFALPDSVAVRIEARDEATARRELYVAITRAKQYCTISFARNALNGSEQELAHIITAIPEKHFVRTSAVENEQALIANNPTVYVSQAPVVLKDNAKELIAFVQETYANTKVSVTLLNNFFECPWKWYFRNLLQLPEIKTESLLFGSAVHASIEALLKKTILPEEKAIADRMKSALLREGVYDEKSTSRMIREGVPVVMRWADEYLSGISDDHTAERSVSYHDVNFAHLQFYGKIDLTEYVSDDAVMVTDFKTGSPKTTGVIEKRDDEGRLSSYVRQLAMYSYLLQSSEKGKRVSTSRLLFLEAPAEDKNRLYSTQIDTETIDLLCADIKEYDDLIKNGEWVNRPCFVKSYGNGGEECGYCKRARILYQLQ